ncbi:DNA-binding response OmpR family regulator [Anaerosolibacter carboniphilus]|uniref:Stage 0 sporulation protein A homolog n=1 Tax=Anaerosolibacter carboniphilus TaxID=1417629 RepID=A0A841KLT5_9FIRM|nr:response regulator transcription factor [Anaerosolibacter carboniphilus]MBB6214363.1 DNA-binding response OmpR family regulator [Anaerosolibacter carboniphilus]
MSRILVVEDDQALAMGIEFALKKEEFEVQVADNIQAAKKAFQEERYQLVLLDVMLPDGSGYDLCREIRETSKIPVIFLTACDEEVNVVLGLDIGGDDYITKPFRVKELISRIRAVLRRQGGNQENTRTAAVCIKSGDIALYPLETKVTRDNKEILLTPAEYKLLSALIQNPMQTLGREIILEKLWDMDGEFVDDNTVSVYIRRLREKLEDNPSKPEYIVTVRGIGYKWNKKHQEKR